MRPRAAIIAPVCCAMLAACASSGTGSASTSPLQTQTSPVASVASKSRVKVAVILMENAEFSDIIGQSSTPYINSLAKRYGLAKRSFAVTHPSLPNYLALTSGSTHGINSDCTSCLVSSPSLASQLSAKHISWKAYMENLPGPCFKGASAGEYAMKHDPFMYYRGIRDNARLCRNVVPLTQLSADEKSGLPRFVWITPNLCNDMHDCDKATGDRFLAGVVPGLLKALGPDGLLFLTWDEGTTNLGCCHLAAGGHIATIVAGAGAKSHAQMSEPVDHYSVLETIEDLFGLRRLGHAACACTPTLQPLLKR